MANPIGLCWSSCLKYVDIAVNLSNNKIRYNIQVADNGLEPLMEAYETSTSTMPISVNVSHYYYTPFGDVLMDCFSNFCQESVIRAILEYGDEESSLSRTSHG